MARSLAHVEVVRAVEPIENADNIELARVLGWQCVVKKGEVEPGDAVVYFEIDSFLPVDPRYEFLRPSSFKTLDVDDGDGIIKTMEGFRLRTIKLRGQLSQGLVLPVTIFEKELKRHFPWGSDTDSWWIGIEPGTDVTGMLGIRLYDPPVPASLRGLALGRFPRGIPMTEQERIQNHPEWFEKYRDVAFEATEKIHGTSGTYLVKDGILHVCNRTLDLKDDGGQSVYWRVARESGIEHVLKENAGERYAIQGEVAGEGINKNPLKIKGVKLFIFDIWDVEQQRYLTPGEREPVARAIIDACKGVISHVPVIDPAMKPFTAFNDVDGVLRFANGPSAINPSAMREGLVFKSRDVIDGQTFSFKVVDNAVLLKEK